MTSRQDGLRHDREKGVPGGRRGRGPLIAELKGRRPALPGNTRIKDNKSGAYLPMISHKSAAIDRSNIESLVDVSFVSAEGFCARRHAKACAQLDITT